MEIVIASGRLKEGVSEQQLIAASDEFDEQFVQGQPGVLRREIVRYPDGRYADIVVFRDAGAIEEVVAAEANSPVCHAFMALFEQDAGSFETATLLKRYAKASRNASD